MSRCSAFVRLARRTCVAQAQMAADIKAREQQAADLKNAGNEAFKGGHFQEAVQLYTQALDLDADNAVLFSNRSGALAAIGNYTQALVDAERCVALRPDWAKGCATCPCTGRELVSADASVSETFRAAARRAMGSSTWCTAIVVSTRARGLSHDSW